MSVTESEVEKYCISRNLELVHVLALGNPLGHLCVAAFVDFLAGLAKGGSPGRSDYKKFVTDHMPPGYAGFQYASGLQDLPEQFYHVFRCGIIHAFSLKPDAQAGGNDGRDKSILIGHRGGGGIHLSNYTQNGYDAAVLIAEDLVVDLDHAISDIFSDPVLAGNAVKRYADQPPIGTTQFSIGTETLNTNVDVPSLSGS